MWPPDGLSLGFKGWTAWDDIFPAGRARGPMASGEAFCESDLRRTGVYALAHFDEPPPPSDAIATHLVKEIIYIGETHGSSVDLRSRLAGFGASAGFFGTPTRGHYAAWWYPWRFPERRPFDVPVAGKTSTAGLYVALHPCPYEGTDHPDAPGVYPVAVEGLALWNHVAAPEGSLPVLNNKGKGEHLSDAPDVLPPVVVGVLFDGSAAQEKSSLAARWLVGHIGLRIGAKPWNLWKEGGHSGWDGHGVCLGTKGRYSIYLGHYTSGPSARRLTLSAYDGDVTLLDSNKVFGRKGMRDAAELSEVWQLLWEIFA